MAASPEKIQRLLRYHQQDPENVNLLLEICQCYHLQGNKEQTQHYLELAQAIAPQACQTMQGLVHLSFNQIEQAIATFEQSVQQQQNNQNSYYLSYSHFLNRDFESAYRALCPVMEQARDKNTRLLMARIQHHRNHLDEAIELLQQAQEEDPETYGLLALLHFDNLNEEKAHFCAEKALMLAPDNHDARCVSAYLKLSKHQCSSQVFLDLIERAPEDGRLYSALGNAQMLELNLELAEQSLKRSTQLMPTFAGTWLALGWCQLLNDHLEHAHLSFTQAKEIDKSFAEPHGGLAIIAVLKKEFDQARHLIKITTKLDPKCHLALLAQALLHNHNAPVLAKSCYDKAIKNMALSAGLIDVSEASQNLVSKTIH